MKIHIEPTFAEKIAIEEKFFSEKFIMSYSGLNKLIFSPDAFYRHYVLKQRDDVETQSMIEGSLLHCLLLQPENFDKYYILTHEDTPSPSQMGLFAYLFEFYKSEINDGGEVREDLAEYSSEILKYLEEINLYQSLKNDVGRLSKVLNETNEAYWEYLKKAEGRKVIDHSLYNHITEAVEKIKSNPAVMDCLGFFADPLNGIKKMQEIELVNLEVPYSFGIRGIIDSVVFDPDKKEIRINDLKSTTKNLSSFTDSIDFYNYWIQASIYVSLVKYHFLNKPEYNGWNITYRFVVVDKYCQAGIIKVSDETIEKWEQETKKLLEKADYHFIKQDFKLPYEFLINNNELVI